MTDNAELSSFAAWRRRRRHLKVIGVIVLALGFGSATFIYWRGNRSPDITGDISMVGYSRAQTRQMENLYGKMGPMIDDWVGALERPATQATVIAAITIVVATGCFLFDRQFEEHRGGS